MSRENARINSFDWLRVIAIIGILICHSCNKFPESDWFGFFCACTFNFLFLILSAFLMGITWNKNGRKALKVSFVKKRFLRLSSAYYPFLIFLFLILYFYSGNFNMRNIITHVLYLPWFDKISGYHHLWFMTLIIACYITCYFFSKIINLNFKNSYIWIILGIITIVITILSYLKNIPTYFTPYLFCYLIVFNYSDKILNKFEILFKNKFLYIISIIIFALSLISFYFLQGYQTKFIPYLIGILAAISIFYLITSLESKLSSKKTIELISFLSFNIYLVHMFFLSATNVYSWFDNVVLSFISLLILSMLCAYILNLIEISINKHIFKTN